jgi:hypothetical protein
MEEIVSAVRSKDLPLEKSLDLYEEALDLGNRCIELLDSTDFSDEELQAAGDGSIDAVAAAEQEIDSAAQQAEGAGDGAPNTEGESDSQ